ncbi:MAG: DUF6402 family protein [Gemmataceae bacterium]
MAAKRWTYGRDFQDRWNREPSFTLSKASFNNMKDDDWRELFEPFTMEDFLSKLPRTRDMFDNLMGRVGEVRAALNDVEKQKKIGLYLAEKFTRFDREFPGQRVKLATTGEYYEQGNVGPKPLSAYVGGDQALRGKERFAQTVLTLPYNNTYVDRGLEFANPPDDLLAAMGSFDFGIIPIGFGIRKEDGGFAFTEVTIVGYEVYVIDRFDFNGEQYLGHWRAPKVNDTGELYRDITSFVVGPQQIAGFALATDGVYRKYRDDTGRGHDFIVMTSNSMRGVNFAEADYIKFPVPLTVTV